MRDSVVYNNRCLEYCLEEAAVEMLHHIILFKALYLLGSVDCYTRGKTLATLARYTLKKCQKSYSQLVIFLVTLET